MGRGSVIGAMMLILVIVAAFAYLVRSGEDGSTAQPSPHAIDQSP